MNGEIKYCRSCDSDNLLPIISLGDQYVTNFVEENNEGQVKCPLDLIICENCKLVQLKHNAPPESMWNEQYWYKSGISSTIRSDLNEIVKTAKEIAKPNEKDVIVDIGCNDGTLLKFYGENYSNLVGFEPSNNVAKDAREKGLKVINNFFNYEDFKKEFGNEKAKIITSISMFYDLEDPNKFMEDIVSCLDKNGLLVIQQNYLLTMLTNNAFDNICHEHREYYSLLSLRSLLDKFNLEVFDIIQNEINGGSIRTYIKFKNNVEMNGFEGSEERIKEVEKLEKEMGLETLRPYQEFALRINRIKENLIKFINEEKMKGKKICAYGASTRGNVVLQYFDLDEKLIECIADKNPDKWGKKTVGSLIPIVSPEDLRKINPDYMVVLVWHFFEEIKNQEEEYFRKGGKFIVPLPDFKVVQN
ncbi:MAG: class I SAM-dependent methyltransferase [Nanoarchaeota archaeon]|nr:class I SAM-dependent methyltransferase [Nanoarchaeota archaeon]